MASSIHGVPRREEKRKLVNDQVSRGGGQGEWKEVERAMQESCVVFFLRCSYDNLMNCSGGNIMTL